MTPMRTPGWKAILAIGVAAAGLLWHVLACTESPMAFSPDGKELAFVTVSPYDLNDLHVRGRHGFRLIVASGPDRVSVVEETDRYMLTAPAYSPDGKYLAYFRIPLLSENQRERIAKQVKKRAEALDEKLEFPAAKPADPNEADANAPETEDLALPPLGKTAEFYKNALAGPMVPVELVVRDAKATEIVVATAKIDLPVYIFGSDKGEELAFQYLLTRPQYSPDGKWVYFCLGNVVGAIEPKTGKRQLLAAPATVAALSPDGKTLATAHDKNITFVDTAGKRTTAVRWEKQLSPSGIVWADARTLALLSTEDKAAELHLMRTDGTVVEAKALPTPEKTAQGSMGELAIAPDGKRMVVAYGEEVHFLDEAGKAQAVWKDGKHMLCQPTFGPDGKRVAFKRMTQQDGGEGFVTDIVFFSAEGKELSTIKIPPPKIKPEKE